MPSRPRASPGAFPAQQGLWAPGFPQPIGAEQLFGVPQQYGGQQPWQQYAGQAMWPQTQQSWAQPPVAAMFGQAGRPHSFLS